MGTGTAGIIWRERLGFCIAFYEKLVSRLECSGGVADREAKENKPATSEAGAPEKPERQAGGTFHEFF